MHALSVASQQEGEQVSEYLEHSDLEDLAKLYRQRYNNGLLTSSQLKDALLAIQREVTRRENERRSRRRG